MSRLPAPHPTATAPAAPAVRATEAGGSTVAYVMSRFPKLTETFVLFEVLSLERLGARVELFPLMRERQAVVHPEAEELVGRAVYQPFMSREILRTQLRLLRRRTRRYLGTIAALLRGTWGSPKFLLGGLAILPKVAHAAMLIEQRGIRHVHCHFASHPAAAGFIIHRLTGIPFSFTAHGSDLHVDRHMLTEKVAAAAFVVAISDYNRRVILEECGARFADKVIVLHTGVDTDVLDPPAERHGGPFTILCVGTLHEVKGQEYLIDACRRLAESGSDFVCRLIGEGPDADMLRERAAGAGLDGRIRFEGPRTRDDVVRLLRAADVVAAPSVPTAAGKREGIPVALMEAMSCGLAVVASRLSGIPELVDDEESGLLVEPRDAEGLFVALKRLHDDEELRMRLGRQARAKIVAQFDLAQSTEELLRRFTESSP